MSHINLDLQASHKMLTLLDEANVNTESVIDSIPGVTSPMPVLVSTVPVSPKPEQGAPVLASTAISRESSVPS